MVVTLSGADIRTAHVWGADTMAGRAVAWRTRGNHTRLDVDERFTKGYLGELGFVRVCEREGVRCVYRVQTAPSSKTGPEFTLFRHGHPLTLDVKTAGRKEYRRFMLPVAQDVEADLYIGARLLCHGEWLGRRESLEVEVAGWLPRTYVAALPTATFGEWGVWTRHCLLEALPTVSTLLVQCDRGPIVLVDRARELELDEVDLT